MQPEFWRGKIGAAIARIDFCSLCVLCSIWQETQKNLLSKNLLRPNLDEQKTVVDGILCWLFVEKVPKLIKYVTYNKELDLDTRTYIHRYLCIYFSSISVGLIGFFFIFIVFSGFVISKFYHFNRNTVKLVLKRTINESALGRLHSLKNIKQHIKFIHTYAHEGYWGAFDVKNFEYLSRTLGRYIRGYGLKR